MNRLLTTLFAVWLPLSTLALEKEAREMPKGGIDKALLGQILFLTITFLFMAIKAAPVATARIPPLLTYGKTVQTKWSRKAMIRNCSAHAMHQPCFMPATRPNFIMMKKFKIM